jgi:ABC-type nitrate/sulfonate/bicarbonate transport system substrate-binding protein
MEEGVELELTRYANGSQMSQALAAGELDAGVGGHIQTLNAAQAGADQVFIAPLGFERSPDHLPIALLAAPGRTRGHDLEGAVVAVSAIAAISELQLRLYMAAQGANYDRLELRATRFDEIGGAFARGEIGASSCPDPFAAAIVEDRLATVIDRGSLSSALAEGERVMVAGVASSRSWVAANPGAARGLVEAIGRASDDLRKGATSGTPGHHVPCFDRLLHEDDLRLVLACAYAHGLAERESDAAELILAA